MPPRRRKTPELCGEHFPYGLADQPADATQVSCSHGAWDVAELKDTPPPKDPEDPPKDPKDPKTGGEGSGE